MKRVLFITLSAMFAFAGVSCTQNMKYVDAEVGQVSALYMPGNDIFVELSSLSGKTVNFSWEKVETQDGLTAFYEVVFKASPTGEIIHRVDAGQNNSVSVSHKVINIAASKAGVPIGEQGAIYWSVTANRGLNHTIATAEPRRLYVQRLNGFEVIPKSLYLAGTGTETGDNLGEARLCRMTNAEEGGFEIYTSLGSGDFRFVESPEAGARTFVFKGGIIEEAADDVATPGSGIYRIKLDFSTKGYSVEKINKVEFNYAPRTADNRSIAYQGGGIWKLTYDVNLRVESWGPDERYSFLGHIEGSDVEIWGSVNDDNGRGPESGEGVYNNIVITPREGRGAYNHTYKFNLVFDQKTVDIVLDMSGEAEAYTHTIKIVS